MQRGIAWLSRDSANANAGSLEENFLQKTVMLSPVQSTVL